MIDGVSVIICCSNSAERLPETLRHLLVQTFSKAIPWEIVIVNNASKDDTRKVAESFAKDFAPGHLRIVEESRPGIAYARKCGMISAHYEFLAFVDDDNWVTPDWIEAVHQFLSSRPEVGAVGARGEPVFEGGRSPDWFLQFAATYAAGPQYPEGGDITDKPSHLLWTAGLSMRKSVFEQLLARGFEFICSDRLGSEIYKLVTLRQAEDTDLCLGIRAIGWRLHYSPDMVYKHFMPQNRLTWAYLRRMTKEYGHCSVFVVLLRCSTDRELSGRKLMLERSWMFQVARAMWRMARLAFRDPRSLLTSAEGSAARLQADSLLGNLRLLFALRGKYAELFDANHRRYIVQR
jgi:glycosyltransferase involved in cell wall biosynthesis